MKKNIKYLDYIINCFIVLCILFLTLKVNDIYPFGKYDFARYDAVWQYKPFLYSFISSLQNGNLYSYSFLNGLGSPFLFNYVYYLSSPLNFICLLFKNPDQMFFAVTLFKIIIGSFISYFYFFKKTNNKIVSMICSISYIYSAWFLSNYFNIMWLDAFIVFPLFHYGLEKLISDNKLLVYVLSLSYIMISNFYMAFIVCLYTLVYYLFSIIIKKDKYKNKLKNFDLIFIGTIVVFLISFYYIFDVYSSLIKIGIYVSNIANDFSNLYILNLIKSIFSGISFVSMTTTRSSIINVSCGLLMTISYFYYFINKKIPVRDRIIHFVVTIFILALVSSKTLNYIANGFHIPVGYHYRYSFIISFYSIRIFCRNYLTWDGKVDKRIYVIMLLLLILLVGLNNFGTFDFNYFIMNIVLLFSYFLWLLLYNRYFLHNLLLLIIVIGELFYCVSHCFVGTNIIGDYNYEQYGLKEFRNDSLLVGSYIFNENIYSKSSEITSFTSMQYLDTIKLLGFLGCSNDEKAGISGCQNTKFFNMIFNIYSANYNLNKSFAVNNDILSFVTWDGNYIENQNRLAKMMTGVENLYIEENDKLEFIDSMDGVYRYKLSGKDTQYYLAFGYNTYSVKNNDNFYNFNLYYNYGLRLENGTLEVKTINGEEPKLSIYAENEDKIKNVYDYLSRGQIMYSFYQDDLMEGKILVDDDQLVFTSIPYDDSWTVYVDGEAVNTIEVLNSLLAFQCPKGEHEIKLVYKSINFISIIISLLSLISFILIVIFFNRSKMYGVIKDKIKK